MARRGEKFITDTEFETRNRNLNYKITSVLAGLVFKKGSGEIKNFLIQIGFNSPGTIAFEKPFKTGTVPVVVATPNDANFLAGITSVSATQFKLVTRYHDGELSNADCYWVAIGECG